MLRLPGAGGRAGARTALPRGPRRGPRPIRGRGRRDRAGRGGRRSPGHPPGYPEQDSSCLGLLSLVAQIRETVTLPIAAAGGLMRGSQIAAVLVAGVSARLGMAFLATHGSGAHDVHKQASRDRRTRPRRRPGRRGRAAVRGSGARRYLERGSPKTRTARSRPGPRAPRHGGGALREAGQGETAGRSPLTDRRLRWLRTSISVGLRGSPSSIISEGQQQRTVGPRDPRSTASPSFPTESNTAAAPRRARTSSAPAAPARQSLANHDNGIPSISVRVALALLADVVAPRPGPVLSYRGSSVGTESDLVDRRTPHRACAAIFLAKEPPSWPSPVNC